VRKPLARLFLFGDSALVSHDFKGIAYILNEELGVPTFRRTFGYPGAMETVYAFVNETPAEELRGKAIVVEISEGSGVWVSGQVNGAPVSRTLGELRGRVLYHAAVLLRAGDRFRDPAARRPSDLARRTPGDVLVAPRPGRRSGGPHPFSTRSCTNISADARPSLFYDRDLAFTTWDEPYFEGRTAKVSLENWLRRIGRRAREKGAGFGVLYVPTKLSAYWPILRPIPRLRQALCIRPRRATGSNRTIRSHESLRVVLPRSIESWRTLRKGAVPGGGDRFHGSDRALPGRRRAGRGRLPASFDTTGTSGDPNRRGAVARFAEGGGS